MVFVPFLKNAFKVKQLLEVTINSTNNAFLNFPKVMIGHSNPGQMCLYVLCYV